jgi:hypothetical protein
MIWLIGIVGIEWITIKIYVSYIKKKLPLTIPAKIHHKVFFAR